MRREAVDLDAEEEGGKWEGEREVRDIWSLRRLQLPIDSTESDQLLENASGLKKLKMNPGQ